MRIIQFVQETKKMALSMRLNEEAEARLKNFVINLDGKDGESLQYIILEGDYVLIIITRHIEQDSIFSKLRFVVREYRSVGNGEFQCLRTCAMKIEQCLRWIKDNVSPDGARTIESSEKTVADVLTSDWFRGDGKPCEPASKTKIRSAMEKALSLRD